MAEAPEIPFSDIANPFRGGNVPDPAPEGSTKVGVPQGTHTGDSPFPRGDGDDDGGEPTPTPTSTPTTTPEEGEPKEGDTPPPAVKGQREPSRKQLSEQLQQANATLEKMKSDGDVLTQKYKDAETKAAEALERLRQHDEEYKQSNLPRYQWEKDPEVASRAEKVTLIRTSIAADMDPEVARILKADMHKILHTYDQAILAGEEATRKLREGVIQTFGEEDGKLMIQFMKEAHMTWREARDIAQKNASNYSQTVEKQHDSARRGLIDDFRKLGRASEDEIRLNPDDVNSLITSVLGKDEEFLKELDLIAHRAAESTAGPPPLKADASDEQIAAHRKAVREREAFLRTAYRKDVEVHALKQALKRTLSERDSLAKRVGAAAAGNRPDSKSTGNVAAETRKPVGWEIPDDVPFEDIKNPAYRLAGKK